MRAKNSVINIKYNLIFTVITLILSFISRRIFLDYLGADIAGVNTLLLNFLGLLNLVELGVGSAVTYSLYEPLAKKDNEKINEIMYIFKKIYSYLGIIAIGIGILMLFVFKYFVKDTIPFSEIALYYFIYLANSVCTYFFTYKYILVSADQKAYVVTKYNGIMKIIKIFVQILILILFKNFFIWLIIEIIFNLLTMYLTNMSINKMYSNISFNSNKSLKELLAKNKKIVIDTKNIFWHKVGTFVVYQTDSFVISAIATLKDVTMYSNYMMIINNLVQLVGQAFAGTLSSIGNLVAEKDDKRSFEIWQEMYSVEMFVGFLITFCVYKCVDLFINLWVGGEFIFNNAIVIILCINFFIMLTRQSISIFKTGYGIFWDVFAPIIESIINLVFSIALASKFGIIGVFIGTFISNIIIVLLWIPYIVFKQGFKQKFTSYLFISGKFLTLGIIPFIIMNYLCNKILVLVVGDTFIKFFIYGIIIFTLAFISFFAFFWYDKSFRIMVKKVKNTIIK